jgi:4-carboxymuconolactone decarboxylase
VKNIAAPKSMSLLLGPMVAGRSSHKCTHIAVATQAGICRGGRGGKPRATVVGARTVDDKRRKQMAQSQSSPAREAVRDIVPGLIDLSERVLFGEVWERPGLSKRDRSLITCATLIALGRERQLVGHLQRALDNGLTQKELSEVITHLAFYAGWPAAMTAALVAKDVFEKNK